MLCISPPTNLVDTKCYGIREVMGLQRYGLREVRLYKGWFRLLYSFGVIQPLWPTYNKPVFAGGYDMPPNGFKVVLAKLFMLCRGGL